MDNGKLNITVLLGGLSAEREISLLTGKAAAKALRSIGHTITEFDPKDAGTSWKLPEKTDVIFLALHGTYGEDGTVQQHLESLGIPYTGCGVEASRTAFDKVLSKRKFVEAEIPTPRFEVLNSNNKIFPLSWQLPVVLKPVRQGSSVGLFFINDLIEFEPSVNEVLRFDTDVLMEEKITGRESTVGILADECLPIIEIRPKEGSYDYHNKYTKGATEYLCPAPFDQKVTEKIQQVAFSAYHVLGCRDYARVDVMIDNKNNPYVLEVNTLPGLTETSLLPKAAAAAGISYEMLCQKMIDIAMTRKLR